LVHQAAAVSNPPKPRIIVVDKPERAQTQIVFGQPAMPGTHAEHLPLQVAVTAFGGTFTAPLMHEVREVRGWSYGAHASLSEMRDRGAVTLSAATAVTDTVPCLELMLSLYRKLIAGEYPDELFAFAQTYLLNQFPFSVATPDARLGEHLHAELIGLPPTAVTTYSTRLAALRAADVRGTPARHLTDRLVICLLGTASALLAPLQKANLSDDITVIPYDEEP
jgi:predicted Zn-dependent peptidase